MLIVQFFLFLFNFFIFQGFLIPRVCYLLNFVHKVLMDILSCLGDVLITLLISHFKPSKESFLVRKSPLLTRLEQS